jgi:hypothetical protein
MLKIDGEKVTASARQMSARCREGAAFSADGSDLGGGNVSYVPG